MGVDYVQGVGVLADPWSCGGLWERFEVQWDPEHAVGAYAAAVPMKGPHIALQSRCILHAQALASICSAERALLQPQAGAASSEEQLDKQSPWELFDEGVTVSSKLLLGW